MKLHRDITDKRTIKAYRAFEDLAITKHNGKYSYVDSVYNGSKVPISIICPEHGVFKQTPNNHLRSNGCSKCGRLTCSTKTRCGKEAFIKKAVRVHGDTCDYSKVNYINNKTPVEIICKQHGRFTQTPNNHLYTKGCSECKTDKLVERSTKSFESFVKEASIKHDNKYTYKDTEFTSMAKSVPIICPIHGEFTQIPSYHLWGNGCTACGRETGGGFNKELPAILYYISIDNGEAYKIGITNKSIEERFKPSEVKRIKLIKSWEYQKGEDAYREEQRILKEFKMFKYRKKELLSNGNTEIFVKDVLCLDIP